MGVATGTDPGHGAAASRRTGAQTLLLYACGVVSREDLAVVAPPGLDENGSGSPPPSGFAAHTPLCRPWVPGMPPAIEVGPSTRTQAWLSMLTSDAASAAPRPGAVSSLVAVVLDRLVDPGGTWPDRETTPGATAGESSRDSPREAAPGGGSDRSGAWQGERGEQSRALEDGRGLVLAVVCDNHPEAGKEAGVAILNDLATYYQVRGDALPRTR